MSSDDMATDELSELYITLTSAIRKRDFVGRRKKGQPSRERTVVWLRKKHRHRKSARNLARRIADCRPPERGCGSAACPDCGSAGQKRLTRLLKHATKAINEDTHVFFVTVASAADATDPARLKTFDAFSIKKIVTDACAAAEVAWGVLALDVSINEHRTSRYPLFALPHIHGIVVTQNAARLREALKKVSQPSDAIPRPVRVTRWDGNPDAFRYLLKQQLDRRIGVDNAERFDPRTGKKRLCRAVRKDRPRSAERREMLLFLDRIGIDGRVIFVNARLVHIGRRVRIITPADEM